MDGDYVLLRDRCLPEPGKILITPAGKPACTANSANLSDVSGVTWNTVISLLVKYSGFNKGY
jgi:hypothetical protein